MSKRTTYARLSSWALPLLLLTLGGGCASHQLRSAGYTSQADKVWYQWWHGASDNTIVVCDVAPNGTETNCVESQI